MQLFLNKKNITYFIKLIIGCGLFFYLLSKDKINFDFFQHENASILIQLFAIEMIIFAIATVKWHRIGVNAYDMNISLLNTTYISWIAQFFSTFFPSTVGTDLSRVYYVSKKSNMSVKKLIKITIVDRSSSLLILVMCSLLGLVFYLQKFNLFMSILVISAVLILLKLLPKKKLKQTLLKKDIHLPPFSVVLLSLFSFMLKAFSLFIIIYSMYGMGDIKDYYLCVASQFIEGMAILPANIGMGHFLFDKALGVIENINGAQIYNVYFTVKVLFKVTGFAGWLLYRI